MVSENSTLRRGSSLKAFFKSSTIAELLELLLKSVHPSRVPPVACTFQNLSGKHLVRYSSQPSHLHYVSLLCFADDTDLMGGTICNTLPADSASAYEIETNTDKKGHVRWQWQSKDI